MQSYEMIINNLKNIANILNLNLTEDFSPKKPT